jgi:hypothetical protein
MSGFTVVNDPEFAVMRDNSERYQWLLPLFERDHGCEDVARRKALLELGVGAGMTGSRLIDWARSVRIPV